MQVCYFLKFFCDQILNNKIFKELKKMKKILAKISKTKPLERLSMSIKIESPKDVNRVLAIMQCIFFLFPGNYYSRQYLQQVSKISFFLKIFFRLLGRLGLFYSFHSCDWRFNSCNWGFGLSIWLLDRFKRCCNCNQFCCCWNIGSR